MMKVCYSEMDTPAGLSCRLEAAGHAGYAPAGQDIVCAGASTVMQGLVYYEKCYTVELVNMRERFQFYCWIDTLYNLLADLLITAKQILYDYHLYILK